MLADFSSAMTGRQINTIMCSSGENPEFYIQQKIPFKNEGEIKTFLKK